MWERSGGGGGRDVMIARGCFDRLSEVSFGHSVTLVWTRRRAAQGEANIGVKVTQQAWGASASCPWCRSVSSRVAGAHDSQPAGAAWCSWTRASACCLGTA